MKRLSAFFASESGVIHTLPLLVIVAAVGIITYLLISSAAPFNGGLFGTINPKPDSHAATLMTYTTSFPLTENPISEGGVWLSGKRDSLDWADTRTTPGKAFGTQTGSNPLTYDDSVAILKGTFAANQEASATVFNNRPAGDYNSEVELHLRSGISAHNVTGYEFEYSTRADNTYCDIVRWNGAWNGGQFWTPLVHGSGGCGVKTGDVVKATAIGNVLTAYINGVQVLQATDNTFTSGNPGVGYYLRNISQTGNSNDWGFTNFTASDIGSNPTPTPTPTPSPVPTPTPIPVGTPTPSPTVAPTPTPTPTPISTESAFNGPHNLPGTLQLEDYDNGGEGLAYHDTESANNGGAYRPTGGVDIQAAGDTGGGFNVGWTLPGEWIKYIVNVTNSGTYNLNFRVASQGAGGTFHLEIDGVNVTGTMTVPNTNNKQIYTTITKPNINLTSGAHTLRMFIESIGAMGGAANFNYLTVTPASNPTPTASPTPTPKPTSSPTPTPGTQGSLITITAQGTPVAGVYPTMTLQYNTTGSWNTVNTWTNINSGLKSYTYQSATKVTHSQVRVNFVNDAWNPNVSPIQDRNLNVTQIIIDGVTYLTQSSAVFGSGVWTGNACVSGNGIGNWLYCNGFFQY